MKKAKTLKDCCFFSCDVLSLDVVLADKRTVYDKKAQFSLKKSRCVLQKKMKKIK